MLNNHPMRHVPSTLLFISAVAAACTGCGEYHVVPVESGTRADSAGQILPAVKLQKFPPGIHQQTVPRDGGVPLRFTIAIPDSYSDEIPVPLIVALHYGGDVTPFYGRGVLEELVAPALGELGAIIVAPDSIGGDWTTADNEAAVLQLIDSLSATYKIDPRKTLLTGYSMGGAGTWYLAGRHQDRFTAAIPVSGSPASQMEWRIPVYVIHSRQDDVLPLGATQQFIDRLKSQGCDVQLAVIDGVTHYDTARFVEPLRAAVPWIRVQWD